MNRQSTKNSRHNSQEKSKLSLAHLSIIVILSTSLDTTCALIGSNLSFILPIKW